MAYGRSYLICRWIFLFLPWKKLRETEILLQKGPYLTGICRDLSNLRTKANGGKNISRRTPWVQTGRLLFSLMKSQQFLSLQMAADSGMLKMNSRGGFRQLFQIAVEVANTRRML